MKAVLCYPVIAVHGFEIFAFGFFNAPVYRGAMSAVFFIDQSENTGIRLLICPGNVIDAFSGAVVDDQHFQQILADNFAVPVFLFHFIQHGGHIKEQIFLFVLAAENNIILVSLKRKTEPVYPDRHVFQRHGRGRNLRVGYARIDNHEIVFFNTVFVLLDQKASASVLYIE